MPTHVAFAINPRRAAICGATLDPDVDTRSLSALAALQAAKAGTLETLVDCEVCCRLVALSMEESSEESA